MADSFLRELSALINKHALENGSNTPDFLLATYLAECLHTFDHVMQQRAEWWNRPPPGGILPHQWTVRPGPPVPQDRDNGTVTDPPAQRVDGSWKVFK